MQQLLAPHVSRIGGSIFVHHDNHHHRHDRSLFSSFFALRILQTTDATICSGSRGPLGPPKIEENVNAEYGHMTTHFRENCLAEMGRLSVLHFRLACEGEPQTTPVAGGIEPDDYQKE